MPLGPLPQPPLLHNLDGCLQLGIFPTDIATKELELTPDVGALEEFGRSAGEGCKAGGVGEGLVELLSCGAEFFGGVYGGGVDKGTFAGGLGGSG